MYFNNKLVESFLRENKILGKFKKWAREEERRIEEDEHEEYLSTLSQDEMKGYLLGGRLRKACGKGVQLLQRWMENRDLGFIIYKANRHNDFVYIVYDLNTDTISEQLPYVKEVNEYILKKYGFETGRKGRR